MQLRASYLRLLARCIWVHILDWSGCLRAAEKELRRAGAVVTLTFHRVLDAVALHESNSLAGIVIRECTFEKLVRYLMTRYEPVSLKDFAPGSPAEKNQIAITFDDGWHDNYTTAFNILMAYKLPVTIFICPGLMEQQTPFWPEEAVALLRATLANANPDCLAAIIEDLKQYSPEQRAQHLATLRARAQNQRGTIEPSPADRTLSWKEVHKMDEAGVCFGSHTDTHQILTGIPKGIAREEVLRSKRAIEQELAKPCGIFAYPNGNCSLTTRRIVEEAGFKRAVTTERGAWVPSSDPLAIPRMNVYEDNVVGLTGRFSPAMFRYTTLYRAWRAMKGSLAADQSRGQASTELGSSRLSSSRAS